MAGVLDRYVVEKSDDPLIGVSIEFARFLDEPVLANWIFAHLTAWGEAKLRDWKNAKRRLKREGKSRRPSKSLRGDPIARLCSTSFAELTTEERVVVLIALAEIKLHQAICTWKWKGIQAQLRNEPESTMAWSFLSLRWKLAGAITPGSLGEKQHRQDYIPGIGLILARQFELVEREVVKLRSAASLAKLRSKKPHHSGEPQPDDGFDELRAWLPNNLIGKQRAVIEALLEGGNAVPLSDLAARPGIDWGGEWDSPWKSLRHAVQTKLKREFKGRYRIYQQNNEARLGLWSAKEV